MNHDAGKGGLRTIGRLLGMVVSSATTLIWLAVLWLPSERDVLGHFGVVGAVLMLFFAIFGVIAAHRGHGKLMIAMFIAQFLPIGAFMLWTTQPMYRWLGLLNLIYLVAAIIVRITRPKTDVAGSDHQSIEGS
jgi:uncharacterized membrane protein YqjE